MRKIISFTFILLLGVICSACINSFAIKELNEKALEYLKNGDVPSAISRLESSVDLDGNIYETRYNLAVAYLKVNECQKALEQLDKAKDLVKSSDSAPLYYTIGVAHNTCADKVVERDDDDNKTIVSKEDYLNHLNDALSAFEKYLEYSPEAEDKEDVQNLINQIKAEVEQSNNQTID